MARIQLISVAKTFEEKTRSPMRALDDVSFTVEDGNWVVIAGPSGCGKTTLLRLIAGLETPTAGDILIDGRSQAGVPPQERNIAMVFQEPALYPHMTVRDNIGFGLRVRHIARDEARRRVEAAAQMLALEQCLARKPAELSGGQRHRVALARALVRRPTVFLFDEPLAGLDLPTREQIRPQMIGACRSTGATVIYVTHDQSEAMVTADWLGMLEEGRMQQMDRPAVLYSKPATVFVARFLGWPPMNLCEGTLAGNRFQSGKFSLSIEGSLPCGPGSQPLILGIRPEAITRAPAATAEPVLDAEVLEAKQLGREQHVRLKVADQIFTASWPPDVAVSAGATTHVIFQQQALRFFDPQTHRAVL